MTTTQMQYFLEAARCLNFTVAAEHLYVTQPALSKQIQNLERQLDAELFAREKNTVILTPVGKVLYQELSSLYENYNLMLTRVDHIKRGISGQLDIALLEDQLLNEEVIRAVQALLTELPNVRINVNHMDMKAMHNALFSGGIDFGITLRHFEQHIPEFSYLELENEPEYLIVPASADLEQAKISGPGDYGRLPELYTLIALAGENIEAPMQNELSELLIRQKAEFFTQQKVRYVSSIGAIPLLIVAGLGITVANATYTLRNDPHVLFIQGKPTDRISKGMFWRTDNRNSLVPVLLEYVRRELSAPQ